MITELYDAILDAGYNPPTHLKPIGEVTRFNVGNGKQNKDGWITVFLDGKGSVFGDWKSGNKFNWFESSVVQDCTETVAERNAAMQRAVTERENRYHRAAIESQRIYENETISCDGHGYLDRKSVGACNGLRIGLDGRLIIPVFGKDEKIQSLQYIDNDGNKRFQKDGKMKGGCFIIGSLERGKKALMAEGLATGLTCHDATGLPVIVAFNAGNLKAVFEQFKNNVDIYIAADNDLHGKGYKCALDCVPPDKVLMPSVVGDFNDIGIDATKEMFAGVVHDNSHSFVRFDVMMKSSKKANWVIKGILARGAMGILFGEPASGKSLFALDWAYCISCGKDWHNFKVREKGTVIYIAGEGNMGLAMRMQAILQKYDEEPNENIHFSTKSFDFYDITEVDEVTRQIEIICAKGVIPSAIFIDTMHRNFTGDENSAKDVAIYIKAIEKLAKKYDCSVVTVHHSGHGDKGRVRGSSALKGAHDAEFCVLKDNDFTSTISCTKMKEYPKFTGHTFGINVVELEGEMFFDDDDNEPMTSVHLLPCENGEFVKTKKITSKDSAFFDAIKLAFSDKDTVVLTENNTAVAVGTVALTIEVVQPYLIAVDKDKNDYRKKHDNPFKTLERLEKSGLIGRDNGFIWLIE